MTRHFNIIKLSSETIPDYAIQSKQLRSKSTYMCTKHPSNPAFCLCAKCGELLCEKCCVQIGSRHYCMSCVEEDDALIMTLRSEFFQTANKPKKPAAAAPQTFKEIPRAVLSILNSSSTFFTTAKDSPFALTFVIGFISLFPNAISLMIRIDEIKPILEKAYENMPIQQNGLNILIAMPLSMRIASACVYSVIQVLMMDIILYLCIRGIAHNKMSFAESSSTLHYSLIPLILTGIGTFYDVPVVSFVALFLMIALLTTAVRISSKCSLFQGIAIMLIFIFLTYNSGILRFYGI